MLTSKQSGSYGFKFVHDLPTPPSTSRPSPPLIYQESHKQLPAIPRSHSPSSQPMSGPPRSLPPPAAMTLPPQPAPPSSGPPQPAQPSMPPGHAQAPPSGAPQSQHGHVLGPLPAPPPQWHGAEEAMRSWLVAKAEEERRKQEEERTRQEEMRLEQRRLENNMLQTSISSGMPPSLVPLVFVGLGGHPWSPTMWDWAQQTIHTHTQGQHPLQLMPAPGASPARRRDSQPQAYGPYQTVPPTPTGVPGQAGAYAYPGSPTRGRGHTLSGPSGPSRQHGPGSSLPSLNTNIPQPAGPHSFQQSGVQQQQQQESQPSPIYFHHWQPPASQGDGGSTQPATPSVGEPPRKRKTTSQQQQSQPPPHQRTRSPFGQHGGLGNPPRTPRRGHQRQQSDLSSYASYPRNQPESLPSARAQFSGGVGMGREESAPRESEQQQQQQQQQHQHQQAQLRSGGHSVGSLLSSEPPQYAPTPETHRLPPGRMPLPPPPPVSSQQQSQQQQQQRAEGSRGDEPTT